MIIHNKWDRYSTNFKDLELLRKGESKEIRVIDQNHVIIKLIPSLYSFTHNRNAIIEGTDSIRLQSSKILWNILEENGIKTSIIHVGSDYYISKRLKMNNDDFCPPIEVIVKARHVGSPKHNLFKTEVHETRFGEKIIPDQPHAPYVRFDYTNPMKGQDKVRMRDECIPIGLAEYYIDTKIAEITALKAFHCLHEFLSSRSIRLDDICFKIDQTGKVIFGEISPDCMRATEISTTDFFCSNGNDVSKNTFRAGSEPFETLKKYQKFLTLITKMKKNEPVHPKSIHGRFSKIEQISG